MAERKSFLLRVDRDVLEAVQRWANDDLRSLNIRAAPASIATWVSWPQACMTLSTLEE